MNKANLQRLINSLHEAGEEEDLTDLIEAITALDETTSMTPEGQALISEALDICLI